MGPLCAAERASERASSTYTDENVYDIIPPGAARVREIHPPRCFECVSAALNLTLRAAQQEVRGKKATQAMSLNYL